MLIGILKEVAVDIFMLFLKIKITASDLVKDPSSSHIETIVNAA